MFDSGDKMAVPVHPGHFGFTCVRWGESGDVSPIFNSQSLRFTSTASNESPCRLDKLNIKLV